jgi:transposase-like protein
MSKEYQKYLPEFREEVAKLVIDTSQAKADVAREVGVNETTVGNWVRAYLAKHVESDERAMRIVELAAGRVARER